MDATEKSRPVGIVTDRDLVLALMAEGLDPAVFTDSNCLHPRSVRSSDIGAATWIRRAHSLFC